MPADLPAGLFHFGAVMLPCVGKPIQHIFECGHVVATYRWEVSARIKGLQVWYQKNGHRPAARAGHGNNGLHVNIVNVGAFFSIYFDIDEVFVHQRRGFGVFK